MRRIVAAAYLCVLLLGTEGFVARLYAQTGTHEETNTGGWAGPCDDWWNTTEFVFEAMRVCRVATSVFQGLQASVDPTSARTPEKPIDPTSARTPANQLFRICWGDFPRSGGDCRTSNAWAVPRGWTDAKGTKPPIVITLQATEDLQSDDEIAFVLSHEVGHAVDRGQVTTQNTRENERRADANGVAFLMLAGFDARSSGRGLQMIMGERGKGLVGNLLGMLSNLDGAADVHGLTSDRIVMMKQIFATGCAAMKNKPIGCKQGWH